MKLNIDLDKNAKWVALALFVIAIVTRVPFVSQYLYHWDSVNMAFGMQDYNVLAGAPQFPGYIVFIALAQVVNVIFGDPQRTMVFISVVSTGLAAVTLFYLGRDMFNATSGLIAALFLLSSPLFWFYGEIALPHTLDLFAVTFVAWMMYRVMEGQTRWLWWTSVFVGLVTGFRQQDVLFLAPLILFAGYRIGIRKIIMVIVLVGVVCLAWGLPLIIYSGSFQMYMTASSEFTAEFFTTTSVLSGAGLFGLKRNVLEKLGPYTLFAWSAAAIAALGWLPSLPKWREGLRSRKFWFLFLWIAPTIVFYVFIHMGQQGLVFTFLPPLLLISAEGLRRILATRPTVLQAATAVIVLIGAGVFIFAPAYPLGKDRLKLLTYDTLRQNDQALADKIAAVRGNFSPDNTLLIAANWRHIQYYLPEYKLARFNIGAKFEAVEGQATSADFVGQPISAAELGLEGGKEWQVVVMDEELNTFAAGTLQEVSTPDGFQLAYLPLGADEAYFTDGQTFGGQKQTAQQ